MSIENRKKNEAGVWEVSPEETLQNKDKYELVDVRRADEFNGELGHIEGAKLITLQTDFLPYLDTMEKNKTYVFICRSGQRSSAACIMAMERGFTNVHNMVGGMIAWNEKNLPIEQD